MAKKIKKSDVQDIYELRIVQQGMLYHYLKSDKSNLYTVQMSFSIQGKLNVELLKQSFQVVQSQNEVLRSVFRWEEIAKPIQIILKEHPINFSYHDFSEVSIDAQANEEELLVHADRFNRFDLTESPFIIRLLKIGKEDYSLHLTNHHILYDGWSNVILLREVFQHYRQLVSEGLEDLQPKPSYKAIQLGIQNIDTSPEKEAMYWKDYLEAFEPKLQFNKKEDAHTPNEEVVRIELKTPISDEALSSFSQKHKITKAAILYSVYGILLQKYSASTDVAFGSTVSTRDPSIPGMNEVIGNFISTIPLRIHSERGTSFIDLAKRVNEELIERNAYHNSSLYRINQILGLKSSELLYDSVFAVENYPMDWEMLQQVPGLDISLQNIYENTHVPLVILAFFKEKLELVFTYKTQFIDSAYIDTLAYHFTLVLEQVLKDPSISLEKIALISKEEQIQLLEKFNNTQRRFPDHQSILSLFEDCVGSYPSKTALVYNNKQFTYKELDEKANQVANALIEKGIGLKDIVGLMFPQTAELVIAMLGIIKSGAAFLPIDSSFPQKRLETILEQSGCKLVVMPTDFKDRLPQGIPTLDYDEVELSKLDKRNPNVSITPQDLVYLIFTSGTTGKPKGVMITQQNLLNYSHWFHQFLTLTQTARTALVTSFAFDLGFSGIFPPLLFGGELHILPDTVYKTPGRLLEYVETHKLSYLKMTPSLYSTLVEHPDFVKIRSLDTLVLGGEKIRVEDVELTFELSEDIKIVNHYGPTETTIGVIAQYIERNAMSSYRHSPTIGKPIANTQCYILNNRMELVPLGAAGELYISGEGVGSGYVGQPSLTKEKFLNNPFLPGKLMYKTGDLAKWSKDGRIEFLGRADGQVKIRGYRVEIGEIEKCIARHESTKEVVVLAKQDQEDTFLVCYYTANTAIPSESMRNHILGELPEYMMPSHFIKMDEMPLNANGKLDRNAFPLPQTSSSSNLVSPSNEIEEILLGIWKELLNKEEISIDRNFFEIGGDSLKLIRASSRIVKKLNCSITLTDLFTYPTIESLASFISEQRAIDQSENSTESDKSINTESSTIEVKHEAPNQAYNPSDIAIIGMACRFPGARNANEFWANLKEGKDSISREIEEGQFHRIIKAKGILEDYELFDSTFFNFTPEEAMKMDPQMRIFLECCWEALEDSGYAPLSYEGEIGLYAGASYNPYYSPRVNQSNPENWMDQWLTYTFSTKDFLCPWVSYKLNLRGPSVNIFTACSTSLVAIDTARKDLLNGSCKLAMTGGVSLTFHDLEGYVYQKDMILSPDGYCRAFDENAAGTVGGNGVGILILKKMEDALRDGDNIHAVIKGSASNNDGLQKIGFTAPSAEGQAKVIQMALKEAQVSPQTISYVESHGTGTYLGDPIELKGLKMAFSGAKPTSCAIGSVKTNIGHLNTAAGIAGIIKTVLALKHKQIPPSLHYEVPNPSLSIEESPFYVNDALTDWKRNGTPLRAGVSSFGIGGTNGHVILEEAPNALSSSELEDHQLLVFSAKTKASLRNNLGKFQDFLSRDQEVPLSSIAYTLSVGRTHFDYRTVVVCKSREEARQKLAEGHSLDHLVPARNLHGQLFVWMFPGQGSQYPNMLLDLYEQEELFRQIVDECFALVKDINGKDLKPVAFPVQETGDLGRVHQTEYTQPILFIVEYALARLLWSWGIRPQVMIGHSIGEYAAACLSGVFSLEDALKLVVKRGELMQNLPSGSMLGILIKEEELLPLLNDHVQVSLAAANSTSSCVVSGNHEAILEFKQVLDRKGYKNTEIRCSHAFHSSMMDEILEEFESLFSTLTISPPQIPFISNLTGRRATFEEIKNPAYWSNHLRRTVRFSDGIEGIMEEYPKVLFAEVGPHKILSSLVEAHASKDSLHRTVNLIRHPKDEKNDRYYLLKAIGKLYINGINPTWESLFRQGEKRRISLPTYSFEPNKYPIDSFVRDISQISTTSQLKREQDIAKWFYIPSWKKVPSLTLPEPNPTSLLSIVFIDDGGQGDQLVDLLKDRGEQVLCVRKGTSFVEEDNGNFQLNPSIPEHYDQLYDHLLANELNPGRIVHLWSIDHQEDISFRMASFLESANTSLFSLWNLVRRGHLKGVLKNAQLVLLTRGLQDLLGTENGPCIQGLSLGLLKVISQEYPTFFTKHIDISSLDSDNWKGAFKDIISNSEHATVAVRNGRKWVQIFDPLAPIPINQQALRKGGVYLVTGGLGEVGFHIAKYLQRKSRAKLILIGRTIIPENRQLPTDILGNTELEEVKTKIERLKELEQAGNEVFYHSCDVANEEEMRKLISEAERRFGQICGVFHNAGLINRKSSYKISELSKDIFRDHFEAKVLGTHVLAEILKNKELDFCICSSSIASFLGGLGFTAYASANTYLDYFVQSLNQSRESKWTSVNFDGFNLTGGSGKGITPREFEGVLDQLLSFQEVSQVIISVGDFNARLDQWVHKLGREEGSLTRANGQDQKSTDKAAEASLLNGPLDDNLLTLWREFFGNQEIGKEDDFFSIGGDSLKALRIIGYIKQRLNISLSISDLFEHANVKDLAAFIASQKLIEPRLGQTTQEDVVPVSSASEAEFYPLSFIQKRLYFIHQLNPDSISYNMPLVYKLKGEVDPAKLSWAVKALIERHESLRTSFRLVNGAPQQFVEEEFKFEWETYPFEEDRDAIITRFVRPFDLSQGPLIRAGMVQVSSEEYLFMLDTHHIVSDGVSKSVMVQDFQSLYRGEDLLEPDFQYKDFACWQYEDSYQKLLEEQKSFWIEQFQHQPDTVNLPYDYKRPKSKGYSGGELTFEIGEAETQKLKEMAQEEGLTLFMLLLALYNIFLSKISNQEDIVVGTPISGRNHIELSKVVGMFVNTLPLRNFPRRDLSILQFLSQVKEQVLACFDHQSYSYQMLFDNLKLDRDSSHNPLFDILFGFQNFEESPMELEGIEIEKYTPPQKIATFDLSLIGREQNGKLLFSFGYSDELFQKETIVRFMGHFKSLISTALDNPDQPISQMDILSEKEKGKLLGAFNETETPYPQDQTLIGLFENKVKEMSDCIALRYRDQTKSYADLDTCAERVASYLHEEMGVKKGDLVGIMLEREEWLVICILGILKTGAAYVPIDPNYPKERQNVIIEDANLNVLISRSAYVGSASPELNILDLDEFSPQLSAYPISKPIIQVEGSDLAYVIYTSGSTGKPKGVMIEHHSAVNQVLWIQKNYPLLKDQVALLKMPIVFDPSVLELFQWPLAGASLALLGPGEENDPQALIRTISEYNVSSIHFVPTMLNAFLSVLEDDFDYERLKSLAVVFTGGESLSAEIISRFGKTLHKNCGTRLINLYGPTETTISVTHHECIFSKPYHRVPIGKPIQNTRLYVLGNNEELCPIGVGGELLIAGAGLARGYLGNDDLTEKKFINPSSLPENRVYKTGDLVKWQEDGTLVFLGRKDSQVKVRGYRIELSEIEKHIASNESIKDVAVLKKEGRLIAYYSSREEIPTGELKRFLKERLPGYMVPDWFVSLPALPLTNTGKLDKKALPKPIVEQNLDYVKPSNETQRVLIKIWSDVLKIEPTKIGIHTNFFELGGNSIDIIEVAHKINKHFGTQLSVANIFEYPFISSIAEFIRKKGRPTIDQDDSNLEKEKKQQNKILTKLGRSRN